nr:MAG: capsid protein [Astroviridae sp.]
MESSKPKPQRPRRSATRRSKQERRVAEKAAQKAVEKVERQPRRTGRQRTTILTNSAGVQLGMTVSKESEDRRKLRQLERQLRSLKKQEEGPKVQSVMTTTLTLGALNGSDLNELTRQMRVWLNPCQLKPADAGETATPLTIRGSQYDLWKPLSVHVTFQPLVGPSIVSGSLCFADLDQDGSSAKPESIDSVKARPHAELPIGRRTVWKLPPRYLKGPRGGWWYVDTNETPMQSLGPALNFWTYLETKNLLGVAQIAQGGADAGVTNTYQGPLFLAEMRISYAFANYNPKPSLAQLGATTLENKVEHENAQFANDDDGNLVLQIKKDSQAAKYMMAVEAASEPATSKEEKSSVAWSIAGEAVSAVAGALGPWGWLVRGGWWVIRRIFGAKQSKDDTETINYMVYPGVEDAMRDNPIRQTVTSGAGKMPVGLFRIRQINNPNVNRPTSSATLMYAVEGDEPVPPEPCPEPVDPVELAKYYILPTSMHNPQLKQMPPIYEVVKHIDEELAPDFDPHASSIGSWMNAFQVVGVPSIRKYTVKWNNILQEAKFTFGFSTLAGWSYAFQLEMPGLDPSKTDTPGAPNVSSVWYCQDLTHSMATFASCVKDNVTTYARQGQLHTSNTLIAAVQDEFPTGQMAKLVLKEQFPPSDPAGPKGQYWNQLMQAMGIDWQADHVKVFPIAMWGNRYQPALLFVDTDQENIFLVHPEQCWEACHLTTGIWSDRPTLIRQGAQLLWGSFLYAESQNDLNQFNNRATFRLDMTTHDLNLQYTPPKEYDDFVVLPRSAMNEKQN